jgi:hydroxypyruvate reductase
VSEGARARLDAIFRAALAAVDAEAAVARQLRCDGAQLAIAGRAVPEASRLVVLAAGKAAAAMAAGVEAVAADRIVAGLAVTKDGHGRALRRVAVRESSHPVPDARCEAAAREVLALASGAAPDDVLLVLLSGGASSLLACPQPGLDLDEIAATTAALLAAGADIHALNTVRKHLVEIAGGRLARAARTARVEVLVISDVLGDPLDVIASGPCTPDPSTFADAVAVLARHDLVERVPSRVRAHLEAGMRGERAESPKPGDPALERVQLTIVASLRDALHAAAAAARAQGLHPVVVSDALQGEARVAGRRFGALARCVAPAAAPVCLLAGGETTVTVRGPGRGGRSQELALAAAFELAGLERVTLLAAGTDGSDGPTDAAGAFADAATLARAAARGADASAALERNDAYPFFAAEGGLLRTGPTGTNVMDLVVIEVQSAGPQLLFPIASKSV